MKKAHSAEKIEEDKKTFNHDILRGGKEKKARIYMEDQNRIVENE